MIQNFERQHRMDVKKHLQLRHSLVGFAADVPLGDGLGSPPVLHVADARQPENDRRAFRHSSAVTKALGEVDER